MRAAAWRSLAGPSLMTVLKDCRADGLAVIQSQLARGRAAAALTRSALAHPQQWVQQGFVSAAQLDELRAGVTRSAAHGAKLEAALCVAALPTRAAERDAARAHATAASQALQQADWRLAQKAQKAQSVPVAGVVSETCFRIGEGVAAGAPVLALQPAGAVKLRIFVAQAELPTGVAGQAEAVSCDACGAPLTARIGHIASQTEHRPPVTYGDSQRARLVFMAAAWPERLRGNRMHPRKPPKQSQSRRKAELGLGPNEHLQRRVGLFWGLTRRAGVAKGPARPCIACPDVSPGCAPRGARGPWPPRRGCIRLPLSL